MNKRQGKGGFIPRSSANRYQSLISHEHDDYEVCFPVLSGAISANENRSRALKRETKFPVSACNGRSEGLDVRSKRGLREHDYFEEGRQLEEIAVRALN
ncbi:hypothetical protein U1Q18_032664 [Sarracenia purpurea var. burkii]